MDPSPFARTTFWKISMGLMINFMANCGVGQSTVQRFLSVPDLQAGRRFKKLIFVFSEHFIAFGHID